MNAMQKKALILAAKAMTEVNELDVDVEPEECYIVWFCKTLQNWKALVSTNVLNGNDADYCEVTHNGDKNETYVDVYKKVKNVKYDI